MVDITQSIGFSCVIWILLCSVVFPKETSTTRSAAVYNGDVSNCYADAVYDELIKVIDIVKAHTYVENDGTDRRNQHAIHLKKFQEEEDYGIDVTNLGIGGGFEGVPSIVPTIFKLVGSAITLNSSGLTEGSFGLLPERVSSQITTVLGSLASSILGPGVVPGSPTRPPSRRRRRTTTTTPTTTTVILNETSSTTIASNITDENSTFASELKYNATADLDEMNSTEVITTEEGPSTTDVLFKQSSLGELPVYAAAYAPNYVATTTFPVYANNFLHILYQAPATTTTTVAPTTTTAASTSTSSTSTDPNSYAIPLPFDYMEGIGIGTGTTGVNNLVDTSVPPNVTAPSPPFQYTPPEYGSEYEYEEQTEEAKEERYRDKNSAIESLVPSK